MKQLIWFGEIKWDYLVTRKQQVLGRFPKDWEILYIEPYVIGKEQHWFPVQRGKITVMTIPFLKRIPNPTISNLLNSKLIRLLFGLFGRLYFQIISSGLGFRSRERIIGLSSAYWGKIAANLPASLHFYDANDAHLDFPGTPEWLREYLVAYLQKADLSFAVSPEIQESIQNLGAQNTKLLGNGVDFEHFSLPQNRPKTLTEISRPLLGYAGAMDWLDSILIAKVCHAFPDHEIVLIGPEIRPGWFKEQAELQGFSNLKYLGKVPYEELPAYVQTFALGLIPFVVDELTKPLNPNKLYEYSAVGIPVVSMNYSSTIMNLRDVIFVGESHEDFIDKIRLALDRPEDGKRIELAKAHSWDHVSEVLENTILQGIGALD